MEQEEWEEWSLEQEELQWKGYLHESNFARILQERGQVTSEEAMDGNIGFWIYAISSSFHFLISSFASELFFRDGRSMLMAME